MRELHRRGLPGLSLTEFVVAAWHVLEPATPLLWNWHLDFICRHVAAVLERQPGAPQNLLVNVPPGTMKSLIVSVFAPAWVWLWRPSWRAVFASANPRVTLRDSVRCRELLESEWYRKTFDVKWAFAVDQNAKGLYKNSAGGSRLAITVGSKVTGDRADALFVDDPLDALDAFSKAERERVLTWWGQAFRNRVNEPEKSTRVVIMQRLHEDDLSGHLLKSGDFEHVCLPQEYEPTEAETFLGLVDPRAEKGELLFPARFPEGVLAQERRTLGSRGYAGQHQQRPVPEGGEMFKREWWRFYGLEQHKRPQGCTQVPPVRLPAHFDEVIQSVDCSFKDLGSSDFVANLVVAKRGADRFILARVKERLNFTATCAMVRRVSTEWPAARIKLVEDKANGTAVINTLQGTVGGFVPIEPLGGKEARAAAVVPVVEGGNVYLPEGAQWLEDFVDELASFPAGSNDDQVDALSQALMRWIEGSDVTRARALLGLT